MILIILYSYFYIRSTAHMLILILYKALDCKSEIFALEVFPCCLKKVNYFILPFHTI